MNDFTVKQLMEGILEKSDVDFSIMSTLGRLGNALIKTNTCHISVSNKSIAHATLIGYEIHLRDTRNMKVLVFSLDEPDSFDNIINRLEAWDYYG